MDKEIQRIDDKVKLQLEALTAHEEFRDNHFKGLLEKENSRDRPRITYLDAINYSHNNSKLITEAARELMEFTTQWNLIKKKLDESCLESENPNDLVFESALEELIDIKPHDLFKKIARVKRIPRWRKFDTPLRTDLINQYEFMQRVYKNAPKHLKRMRMSERQRAASDNASFRMKMRWGGY